jgi:hypothetical protein
MEEEARKKQELLDLENKAREDYLRNLALEKQTEEEKLKQIED